MEYKGYFRWILLVAYIITCSLYLPLCLIFDLEVDVPTALTHCVFNAIVHSTVIAMFWIMYKWGSHCQMGWKILLESRRREEQENFDMEMQIL